MLVKRLIQLAFVSLVLGALVLLSPKQANAQTNTLCATFSMDYYDPSQSSGTGAIIPTVVFKDCQTGELLLVNFNWSCPKDQRDYDTGGCKIPVMQPDNGCYLLFDPIISNLDSGPLVVQNLNDQETYNITRQVTGISQFSQLNSCQDCPKVATSTPTPTETPVPPTATPSPTYTPVPLPTNTTVPPTLTSIPIINENPTAQASTPRFKIVDVQTNPVSIKQYERTYLQIKISTEGTKLPENYWSSFSFSGEVIIKSSDGQMVGDVITFNDKDNAYLLPSSSSGQVLINVRLKFNEAVQDGMMEVFVYTNDEPKQNLVYTFPINVSNQDLEIPRCASVIVDKLAVGLPISDQASAVIAANKFSAEVTGCKDISCASKLIVDYSQDVAVEFILKEPGGLLVAVKDALQGQDSLNVCKKPALWLYSILDESIRRGIFIDMRAIHSPALLMVTSPSGERTGFLDTNSPIAEINDSVAFTLEDSEYVYFPAQDSTTQLTGIGQGVMTVDALDVQQGQVIDTSYINVPVSPQTVAKVNSNDSSNGIIVTNGNDTQTIQPDYKMIQTVEIKKSGESILAFIRRYIFLIIAVLLSVLLLTLIFRPKKKRG